MALLQTARTPASSSRAPKPRRGRSGEGLKGWLYASPTALLVIGLFLVPIGLVVQMSASDWPLFTGRQGTNFPTNFSDVVDNRLFWPSVVFTAKYTVITTVILLALGLGLALLVQESTRWKGILRTVILVPSALGLASASLLFYALYSRQVGPLTPVLQDAGVVDESFSFLSTPNAALWSTVFLIVWRFAGFYMLLLLVGLQGISADTYEAAEIDGASRWQQFRHITLPLLRPSLALCTIMCVTGSILAFDQFFILTKGGPDNSTQTVVQVIYLLAFGGRNDLGLAAALSLIVLGALLVINFATFRLLRSPEDS